jgi:hypothetical protein
MDELHRLAARLDSSASAIEAGAAGLDELKDTPQFFGGDAPGRVGDLGRELHAQWTAAVYARRREARRAAERLTDLAAGLRSAADSYAAADAAARERLGGGRS